MLSDPLPAGRDRSWVSRRRSLRPYLAQRHFSAPCRSAAALFLALHGRPPTPASTWADLLEVSDAALSPSPCPLDSIPPCVTWNLRSLRDIATHSARGKRACLRAWLQKGAVVFLQETHWTNADKAVWEADFQGAQIVHAEATATGRGGTSGGVAILLPPTVRLVSHSILVPGRAVLATARFGQQELRLLATYFPPGRQNDTLAALRRALHLGGDHAPNSSTPVICAGDLNAQWTSPRAGEAALVQDWVDTLHDLGAAPLPYSGSSFSSDRGGSQIDFLAVPIGDMASLDCHARWTAFSDHSPLCSLPAQPIGRRDRPMTPAAFRTLRAPDLANLRRRLRTLEGIFQLPRLVATPQLPEFASPQQPGDCPQDMGLTHDDDGHSASYTPAEPASHASEAAVTTVPTQPHSPRLGLRSILDDSPWDPRLAEFGQRALRATLSSWWSDCQRRSPTCVGFTLRQAARETHNTPVTGHVLAWLQARGFAPGGGPSPGPSPAHLTPRDAAAWLAVWRLEAASDRRMRLKPWACGPGARRPALPEHFRIGRMVFGRLPPVTRVRDTDGTVHEHPAAMDQVLWESRESIWGTSPSLPARADRILDYYFCSRPSMAAIPPPTTAAVLGHILHPGGSAPGCDGACYEALHFASNMVAHLLAQAIHAAALDSPLLQHVLGPSVDLLVWIVKAPGADTPAGLRPLQLPSCFRRLFGAVLAGAAGPAVEPHLCTHQAAIAGGTCGPNVASAFAHLGGDSAPPTSPDGTEDDPRPGSLPHPPAPQAQLPCETAWEAALGQWSGPVATYCADAARQSPLLPHDRAVLFADQNKAFERMSFVWISKVLRRWDFPPWLHHGLLALTIGRAVTAARGGPNPPVRPLARSIGMGGTASPLTWNLGYDPIIHVTSRASGAPTPTYVDDLAALLAGAAQALRASFALMFAGQAAGLIITGHGCEALRLTSPSPAHLALLHDLPVAITTWDHTVSVTGLPPTLVAALLPPAADGEAGPRQYACRQCDCAIKTALVPAAKGDQWADLLTATPFGASAVRDKWPYLGISVGSPCFGGRGPRPPTRKSRRRSDAQTRLGHSNYTEDSLALISDETWAKPTGKAKSRVADAACERISPGRRAHIWNSYVLSLIPYPAAAFTPGAAVAATWTQLYRDSMAAGPWCPLRAFSALAVVYGVPGAPRCPAIYTQVCHVLAHVHGRYCGPPGCGTGADATLSAAATWANAYGAPPECSLDDTIGKAVRGLLAWRRARLFEPTARPPRTLGSILYVVLWARTHLTQHQDWFTHRCQLRRWAPGVGHEACLLRSCRSYTAAHHILRFLVNALPGGQRWRPSCEHRPRVCHECGAPAATSWLAPQCCGNEPPSHGGFSLCGPCSRGWSQSDQWALLPDSLLPQCLRGRADRIRESRGTPPAPPADLRCRWGCCPLCGLGEAGAEHLMGWCPAVAAAWYQLRPQGRSFTDTLLHPMRDAAFASHFTHQVVFLHSAMMGRATLTAHDAARRIARATASHTSDDPDSAHVGDCPWAARALPSSADWEEIRRRTPYAAWTTRPPSCPHCAIDVPYNSFLRATSIDAHRSAQTGAYRPGLRATSAGSCPPDTCLAVLWADTQPAAWCVPGEGWLPEPRATATPNASWTAFHCPACGAHRAILRAEQGLTQGDEITVPFRLSLCTDDSDRPVSATFDGGARRVDGVAHAGAGATLWLRQGAGPPRCVAMAFLALPNGDSAQIAEAMGGRLAINLLRASGAERRQASVAGDNLQAIRYCAGTSRLHSPTLHEHLDQGLADLAVEGWDVTWVAVRRRLNRAADACATAALHWASHLAVDPGFHSPDDPRIFVQWHDTPTPLPYGLPHVEWPSLD